MTVIGIDDLFLRVVYIYIYMYIQFNLSNNGK